MMPTVASLSGVRVACHTLATRKEQAGNGSPSGTGSDVADTKESRA